jgi:hypothetical protein
MPSEERFILFFILEALALSRKLAHFLKIKNSHSGYPGGKRWLAIPVFLPGGGMGEWGWGSRASSRLKLL